MTKAGNRTGETEGSKELGGFQEPEKARAAGAHEDDGWRRPGARCRARVPPKHKDDDHRKPAKDFSCAGGGDWGRGEQTGEPKEGSH